MHAYLVCVMGSLRCWVAWVWWAGCGGGGSSGGIDGLNPIGVPELPGGSGGCEVMGQEVQLTPEGVPAESPRLAWDTTGYLVVWSDAGLDQRNIHAVRLDRDGNRASGEHAVAATDTPSRRPTLAARPGGFLVAWEEELEGTGTRTSVMSTTVSRDGEPLEPPEMVATTEAEQARPTMAALHGDAYLGWMEQTRAESASSLARFGARGIETRALLPTRPAMHPVLGTGQDRLAIGYVEASRLRLSFADADLTVVDGLLVRQASEVVSLPTLTWNAGQVWIMAWEERREGTQEVWVAYATEGGLLHGPARLHHGLVTAAHAPVAASSGNLTLIAYHAFVSGAEIMVSLLDGAGVKRGVDLRVTNSPGAALYPAVAASDRSGEFGVVWQDTRQGGAPGIYFVRLLCSR